MNAQNLPKPYYQDDAVTIYHGDSQQLAPLLGPVDIILTDPPYGMSYCSKRRAKHMQFGGIHGDDEFPKWLFGLPYRVALFAFCRWDNLHDIPKPKSFIAWDKMAHSMGDLQHEFGRQWEGCAFYAGPDHAFRHRPVDVIRSPRVPPGNLAHPTEKPTGALYPLLEAHDGDIVLDPFMGSGTTLRAAKDLGRKAIGIELEEKYCEIAARRMAQEVLPL